MGQNGLQGFFTYVLGDGDRVGIGVLATSEAVTEAPEPMERTRRSSTPVSRGKSCLLWSTCVMADAAGLP
jgi:hypothetical protein